IFFFSSRRRHTRFSRDWSSDVCSSDLYEVWAHPLESCWIIASDQSAQQIRDDLASVMDADDGLLVTRLQNEAAWRMLDYEKDNRSEERRVGKECRLEWRPGSKK